MNTQTTPYQKIQMSNHQFEQLLNELEKLPTTSPNPSFLVRTYINNELLTTPNTLLFKGKSFEILKQETAILKSFQASPADGNEWEKGKFFFGTESI